MMKDLSLPDRMNAAGALNTVSANGRSTAVSSGREILLIEDDPAVSRTTEILFRLAGHRLEIAADPEAAFSRLARRRYDAILLDMNFTAGRSGGEEGLACLTRIMADDPDACVIVITAHSGIRIAVAAMQLGARDFIMKPWRREELLSKLDAAIARGKGDVARSVPVSTGAAGASLLLGESAAMIKVRDLVRRIGPTVAAVCVTGPSGAGRTLVASAVHAASATAATSPLRIDLRDPGHWASLDGATGTVILRHPDRLDPLAQARLLDRLLPGLRCIAIADGTATLLPALQRRLCTVEIAVPRLSDRRDDAVILARHFAHVAGETYGRPSARLTPAAEAIVAVTTWPDEVRGLALAIERAVLLSEDGVIDAAAIRPVAAGNLPPCDEAMPAFGLEDAERLMIAAALKESRHNVSRAAAALGLSRGTLYRRMAQHGL